MGYVAVIPLLPALAFAILAPLSGELRNRLRGVAVAGMAGSLVLSVIAFFQTWPGGHAEHPVWHVTFPLAEISGKPLEMGLMLDPISAAMLLVITIVGMCVQIYSLGYMHRDGRVGWYYAALSLFTAAMLLLVLADNFLLLYMAWEVMGLCSYLLIGFWHEQEAPRKASQKAFLTTRVGDVGFAIGLFAMYNAAGTFSFEGVLGSAASWAPGAATLVALMLLFGAMGKSAQVPLHVWLPDAMAGPTPASALIHAATMVAAGVYLVARALPIFEVSGVALTVTLWVGAITAMVGGLLAAVQHDIKKVLAYSTISQLGYMFIALGAGSVVAAMFHLVTHAFFKSLLFLGAGVIIHASHTQDMREMGGLAKHLKITTITFTAGSLALAGVFPFSGFWSKDEILAVLLHEQQYGVFVIALIAAFITAFYVARLWFRVFMGPEQSDELHEAHTSMLAPMVLLASITTVIGIGGYWFAEFLGHHGAWPEPKIYLPSLVAAGAGLALGWWAYGRMNVVLNTRPLKHRAGYAYDMLSMKLYFDLTYDTFVIKPYMRLALAFAIFDFKRIDGVVNGVARSWRTLSDRGWKFDRTVIDGAVNASASGARALGSRLRRIQVGRVQAYQRYVVGAVVLLMLWTVVKGA